jgi:RNA polymerase sigma-70 factor, ECF subfamily
MLQPWRRPSRVVAVTTEATVDARPEAPAGFDELYAAHYADLTVQLYAYFGDRQEAQDVVQEAFCRALARWRQVSAYEDPVAWVRRVAWNLAVSRWRRTRTALTFVRRQRREEPQLAGPDADRVALVAALATLPDTQRRAVVLHYLGDLTVAEIAEREGVAEGTVKSWLHRGRARLADHFAPEEGSDD